MKNRYLTWHDLNSFIFQKKKSENTGFRLGSVRFLGQIVMEIRALTSRNLHCGYKGSRVSRQVRDSVIRAVTGCRGELPRLD